MNCIDAVEASGKTIITRLYEESVAQRMEDTEYIRCVKVVLEAMVAFLTKNPEITDSPDLLHAVLLAHARKLWVDGVLNAAGEISPDEATYRVSGDPEYLAYCFDYVYQKGEYPL